MEWVPPFFPPGLQSADQNSGVQPTCAALVRRSTGRRGAWYRDYVETQVQRDVRDLARVHSPDVLPRLLAVTASHTATLLNVADLAGPFELARQTIHDYVTLLERVFLVDRLPAWHTNQVARSGFSRFRLSRPSATRE